MVTRFNNNTWSENQRWRERNDNHSCIYNAPVRVKENIPLGIAIYVIEMNNDTNQIMGIGRIVNRVRADKKYKIYEDNNYNRYTYQGLKRLDKEQISNKASNQDLEKLKKLEARIFTTKKHLKRGQGISQVTPDVEKEYLKFVAGLFTSTVYNNVMPWLDVYLVFVSPFVSRFSLFVARLAPFVARKYYQCINYTKGSRPIRRNNRAQNRLMIYRY